MAQITRSIGWRALRPGWALLLLPLLLLVLALGLLLRPGLTTDAAQPTTDAAPAFLASGQTVGQSFVAHHGGLSAIDVFLRPYIPGDGLIELRLQLRGQATTIATTTLPANQITTASFYRFFLPIQPESDRRDYAFTLAYAGTGQFEVGTAAGAAYHNGAQHRDDQPQDAQTSFQLIYDRPTQYLRQGVRALEWLCLLVLCAALFVLPGGALLLILHSKQLAHSDDPRPTTHESSAVRLSSVVFRPWAEQLAIAVGISLAFYPVLMLLTNGVGAQWGQFYAWLPAALALLVLGVHALRRRPPSEKVVPDPAARWPNAALALVMLATIGARLLAAQPFEAPLWGDSVQHSVMAQLMLDQGGLFTSWQPYTPYETLTVQYGFAAFVALLSWASGIDTLAATLFVGQVLNALAAFTLYPLATRITGGNRWAGVATVLIAGLLSPMPGFYLNWGRYAQLAGQVILPIALWLLWEALERGAAGWKHGWNAAVLAPIVLAGMALTYYRMPFYYAAFVPGLLLAWALPRWRFDWRLWLRGTFTLAAVGWIAIVVLLPWALRISGGALDETAAAGAARTSVWNSVVADYQIWRVIDTYVPWWLVGLCLIALVWSLTTRRWNVAAIGAWTLGLSLLVAGQLLKIPGTSLLQNFAVVIALYIPASLLAGALLGEAATWLAQHRIGGVALAVALLLATGWGAQSQGRIGDQFYEYVTRPDRRAMDWIAQNTPTDARFLVEGYSIWGGTSAVGADAGWWLPLLAGRANTMPPQYALLNERPEQGDYSKRVVGIVNEVAANRVADPQVLQILCAEGVTHVYVGQLQGQVGFGAGQLFSPQELAASDAFRELYHQDRVYVFALEPNVCEAR